MERPSNHSFPAGESAARISTVNTRVSAEDSCPTVEIQRQFPWINLSLFILTVFTTLMAGALHQGVDLLRNPSGLWVGAPFSFTLMSILLTHEMGHYLSSRYHHVDATLPYFIPAPPVPFLIGTFGAFIRMTSPITNRRALLDIGASGPIAGFVIAILAVAVGLYQSPVIEASGSVGLRLGEPLIFTMISYITIGPIPDQYDVLLHPIAFAGWIGLFVTALNLIPMGQLDGGHIIYAIFGRHHRAVSLSMIPVLLFMGIIGWPGWLLWAVLPLLFGIRHPPLVDPEISLDRRHQIIAWTSLAILILTFTPSPFLIE